jgi:hypothetical protein
MKKTLFALTLLSLMVLLSSSTSALVDVANVNIVLTSQSPNPAEPGGNVDVEVEIQNNGLTDGTDVSIEIFPPAPISLVTGQEKTKTFSRITAGESVRATYKLSVDIDAVSSEYDLDFRVYTDPLKSNWVEKTVSLAVQGNPRLVIGDVTTVPENIEPGGTAKINVLINNVGSGAARQLEAIMDSDASELVPVLSGGRIYLGDLGVGQTMEAQFELSISQDADHKTYLSTLTLNYKDETNTDSSEEFSIGIPVAGTITMDIINTEVNLARGTLDIEVANKGTTDATSLEVKLLIDGEIVGVDYVSTLKATKKTTFSFPLTSEGIGQLVINYASPGLQQNEVTKEIGNIKIISGNGSAYATAFWLIIIIIIVFYVWRKYFRKKKRRAHHTHHHR